MDKIIGHTISEVSKWREIAKSHDVPISLIDMIEKISDLSFNIKNNMRMNYYKNKVCVQNWGRFPARSPDNSSSGLTIPVGMSTA